MVTESLVRGIKGGVSLTEDLFVALYSLVGFLAKPIAYILLFINVSPNQVTASRLLIFTPINIWLVFSDYQSKYLLILLNSLIGFWTDAIDGQMAAIANQKTSVGKLLDPLADKSLTLSVAIIIMNNEPQIFWVIVFFQTTSAIAAGYLYFIENMPAEKLQANYTGKTKMFFYACGFILYSVGLIINDTYILMVAQTLIISGLPLDVISQFKKVRQIFD